VKSETGFICATPLRAQRFVATDDATATVRPFARPFGAVTFHGSQVTVLSQCVQSISQAFGIGAAL
jgi:hypothetical protein